MSKYKSHPFKYYFESKFGFIVTVIYDDFVYKYKIWSLNIPNGWKIDHYSFWIKEESDVIIDYSLTVSKNGKIAFLDSYKRFNHKDSFTFDISRNNSDLTISS